MKFKNIANIIFMMYSFNLTSFALPQDPPDISCYSSVNDFVYERANTPVMCYFNSLKMKNFLKVPGYKDMINNIRSGEDLCYTEAEKNKMIFADYVEQSTRYIRYQVMHPVGEMMFDISMFDLPDIQDNKVLLRMNRDQNVIYTVRKTLGKFGPEYIFRAYMIDIKDNNKSVANLSLFSQCCIEQLPNMFFLRENIKIGVTTLDEVKERIPDTKFNLIGDKGSSAYACADKYGTIVYVHYKKDTNGIFRVDNVRWTCSGYNVLPYLLPIDRQLIDPTYIPSEEIEGLGEIKDSCCNIM